MRSFLLFVFSALLISAPCEWDYARAQVTQGGDEKQSSVAPRVRKSISELEAAAQDGDAGAARRLVDRLINGGRAQPRDIQAADAALSRFEGLLRPNQVALRRYLIAAGANPDYRDSVEAAVSGFAELTQGQKRAAFGRMPGLAPNAFVWVLEEELARAGHPAAAPDGILDAQTLVALSRFCAEKSIAADCRRGPLRRSVARPLADAFWPRPPARLSP